jgi:alkaline phosphatase D
VPAIENVHIYPLIMHILGVSVTTKIDGELSVLAPYLNSLE